MKYAALLLVLLSLLLMGCPKPPMESIKREGKPDINMVKKGDPEMTAAIAKARQTLPEFVKVLQSPRPTLLGVSIKAEFKDPNGSEHMWIVEPTWDSKTKTISGTLANEPNWVKAVKLGDPVTIPADEISDWKYVEKKKLIGGYTLRLLMQRMSPKDRADVEQAGGFKL